MEGVYWGIYDRIELQLVRILKKLSRAIEQLRCMWACNDAHTGVSLHYVIIIASR